MQRTLIAFPNTPEKAQALKSIMAAIGIEYEEEDATNHLLATEANKKNLDDSFAQAKSGNVTRFSLDEIWK